ncbi:P-type ATPase, N-terminal [Phytophthora cactorum]|nr:P-type ATPase, N-terminal [Phytophthora cactorum]
MAFSLPPQAFRSGHNSFPATTNDVTLVSQKLDVTSSAGVATASQSTRPNNTLGLFGRIFRRNRVADHPSRCSDNTQELIKSRLLFVNDVKRTMEYAAYMQKFHHAEPYSANTVRSSKYSALNFLPKSLFEQFRRVANFYFLIISLLQLCTDLSPTNEYSTIGPLMLVLTATMIKEGLEDRARHQQDWVVNHGKVGTLDGMVEPGRSKNPEGDFQSIFWKNVRVGHVIKIHDQEQVPADMVLLFSSQETGEAMCETSSLDGESNLKVRHCIKWDRIIPHTPTEFGDSVHGEIRCEAPNKRLYSFDGVMRISRSRTQAVGEPPRSSLEARSLDQEFAPEAEEIPITIENVLLRGMKLCNTKWVIGVVVGGGNDTKLVQNMKSIRPNSAAWTVHKKPGYASAYPFVAPFHPAYVLEAWVTYLILYNNMVPISLYISLEVVKWYQARRIENDPKMYCPLTGRGVTARTSNVNEDLGQIKYIFSDKTGTLTKNQMLFKVCSIGGIIFDGSNMQHRRAAQAGSDDLSVGSDMMLKFGSASAVRGGSASREGSNDGRRKSKHVSVTEKDVRSYSQMMKFVENPSRFSGKEVHAVELARPFFRCLLLCHSASVAIEDLSDQTDVHSTISRTPTESSIRTESRRHSAGYNSFTSNLAAAEATDAFPSLVRVTYAEVYVRGGEEVKSRRLSGSCGGFGTHRSRRIDNKDQDINKLALHVHYFAAMALRTLLLGYRTLSVAEYFAWKCEFDSAKKALSNREQLCVEVARKIEKSTKLLGATGVEDLLQDGVRECISQLSLGGINIWMLTGDKDETAISVAHMCGLIGPKSKIVIIKGKTKQDCLDEIAKARRKLKREGVWVPGVASQDISLVINGEALELLLADALTSSRAKAQLSYVNANQVTPHTDPHSASVDVLRSERDTRLSGSMSSKSMGNLPFPATPNSRHRSSSRPGSTRTSITDSNGAVQLAHELFLELASQCRTVVACRLSPMQKAQVVSLMKAAPEAHVGIGIYGHEGMQAVRAADFAIATFRHLSRLLLVHGRWNHRRVARVILFSFYKNMALIMTLFLYSLYNGYSGQTLYESYLMVGWNVLYTVLPIFVLGITDEDIRDSAVLRFPFVYRSSLRKSELSIRGLSFWVANALFHSLLVFYFVMKTMGGVSSEHGHTNGLFPDGTAVYGALIITVTLKASLHTQCLYRWTRAHYISLVGGFLANDIILEIDSGLGDLPTLPVRNADGSIDNSRAAKLIYSSSGRSEEGSYGGGGSATGSARSEKGELTPSLLEGEWTRFDPTRTGSGDRTPDPSMQEDDAHSSRALRVQPPVHPLTLEFMGEEHQRLEMEYEITFAFRERSRVMLCLKVNAFMIPLYAAYELLWERESSYIYIRVGYFVCDVLFMRFARTKYFVQHYQIAILLPYCMIGMALTLTISDTGKFAAALYPVGLFVVIRVKFLYALMLSIYNFAFYMLADRLSSMNYSNSVDLTDLMLFALYLVFVITFGAYACYSLQITMRRDFLQSRSLLIEQKRSTQILKNMLPEHVVQRMQKGDTLISEDEQDVTVLFCDITDFASFVNRFSPTEVVSLLDRVYSLFDQICQKHGVRKMETVGKTYMACAGLQGKDQGREAALRAVSMALDMLACLDKCRASNGNGIKLRIGVHSGRVVSGLVGMKKQQFSLFGDTVNTSSRMQSTGVTGRCQISQDFLAATRNKILHSARQRWKKYDPIRMLLGTPPDLASWGGTDTSESVEQHMLTEIRLLNMCFKDDDMENKYLESTLSNRIEGARTTLLALAAYASFTCMRDLLVEVFSVISAYAPQMDISATMYAILLFIRSPFVIVAILVARRVREEFVFYSETKLRNVLLEVHQDAAKFNSKFKTSYPIVLTYFSVVANIIASQSVEFFTRRQIWLKTRTQLETMNADRLLYQMLPAAVVMRLKEGEMVCDQHQQVGILFSDIKGFTSIASQAATAQVVNILASLFCAFDKLTEKHGVFKMQTIGDAYVIVSGLPYVDMSLGPGVVTSSASTADMSIADVASASTPSIAGIASGFMRLSSNRVLPLDRKNEIVEGQNGSPRGSGSKLRSHLLRRSTLKHKHQMHLRSHIRDLLAMARDMHKEVRKVQDPNTGERLQMRIGIHIGNIIGGVIGTTTLRYDMWGPDALTANELESNGVPEKILVSPIVQEVVKDMIDIRCTFHRKINFTNVPMMDTYLVEFIEPDGTGGRASGCIAGRENSGIVPEQLNPAPGYVRSDDDTTRYSFSRRVVMTTTAALAVLTDSGLLLHITSFQEGLPYLVGKIDASLDCFTQLGVFRGKLPRFAIRQRDLHMLEVLQRATQNPRLQKLPQLQFYGVRRCAIQYNSLQLLKWLHATRDKSPTMTDEPRLLGVAVTCYFDNVEIMEWLHSAPEGPHEAVNMVTEVELCRAAEFGNIRGIRWLHEHGCTAFTPLVMDTAATHGYLKLVTFLHESRSEGCTTRAMHGAALNGYHEVVKFLAQNRSEGPSERTLEMAASAGHLLVSKYSASLRCLLMVVKGGSLEWLTKKGTKEKKRRCFGLF